MDERITALMADGADLAIHRTHPGVYVAYLHCLYIDYRGDGPTVEASLAALADDITVLGGERAIGEKVTEFADLVARWEDPDKAAWLADVGEYPVQAG